jgi:hypothetical protein
MIILSEELRFTGVNRTNSIGEGAVIVGNLVKGPLRITNKTKGRVEMGDNAGN